MPRRRSASDLLVRSEQALGEWQAHMGPGIRKRFAQGQRETQVERARIEQLENQQRRLLQQQERQEAERLSSRRCSLPCRWRRWRPKRRLLRAMPVRRRRPNCRNCWRNCPSRATGSGAQTQALNALRAKWQEALGTQVSTEALQQAALGKVSGKVTQWLKAQSLDHQPRVAQQLRGRPRLGEGRWETVLGSYLEAVCVDGLDGIRTCSAASTAAIWPW